MIIEIRRKMMLFNNLVTPLIVSSFIVLSTIDAFQVTNERRGVVVPMGITTTHHPRDESTATTTTGSTILLLPSNTIGTNLPPVIQQIANERAEFQINLGRAMDALRKDMPYILSQTPGTYTLTVSTCIGCLLSCCACYGYYAAAYHLLFILYDSPFIRIYYLSLIDFSIYHDDISVIDPSGVQLKGIDKYKSAFTFLQTFSKFWFHQNSNTIQYRMVYDFCRNSIRISWHIVLISKFLPTSRPLHIDGISFYQLDVDSGKIIEHKIETLIVNNTPIAPPYGILSILQQDVLLGNTMRPVPQGFPAHIVNSIAS